MNYYQFNEAIMNSTQLYNYYNKGSLELDYINIMKAGTEAIPNQVTSLLLIGITLLIIYYYILPIWNKYFYSEDLNDYCFKFALIFISMALLNLLYFKNMDNIYLFYIKLIGYVLIFIGLYYLSKWLIKRYEVKNGKRNRKCSC